MRKNLASPAEDVSVRFLEFVRRHCLLLEGSKVVAAVSGGADSTALLHLLRRHRETLGIELSAAHLDHGLRGQESDRDARMVAALCASLDVPLEVSKIAAPDAARKRSGLEAACREARHAFLREALAKRGAQAIALGHTLDDRAETILLNLMRGCGIDGLASMRPAQPPLIRPMLEFRRFETEAYCKEQNLEYAVDRSNLDLGIRRNRVRAELLPLMRRYWNPSVELALVRLGELAEADADCLNEAAESWLEMHCAISIEGDVTAPVEGLLEAPRALRGRIVRLAAQRLRGTTADIEREDVAAVLEAAANSAGTASFSLAGGGGRVDIRNGLVTFSRPVATIEPFECVVELAGTTVVQGAGLQVVASRCGDDMASEAGGADWSIRVPVSAISPPVRVRNRRPGDRIRAMGAPGTKKLQDLMIDRKIPRQWRDRIPVFCDREGPFWAPGLAVDTRVAVALDAEAHYCIKVLPEPELAHVLQCTVALRARN